MQTSNKPPIMFPITYKCNLSCKYCTSKDSKDEPDLVKCFDILNGAENEWVYITGGEPLLVKTLESFCAKLKKSGKKIGITTNGTIENDRIHLFADRVGVSIDGDKKYHDEYRQGSYDTAVSFLKNIVGKVETVLMFTLFPENKHCIESVTNLGESLGVSFLQIEKGII